MQFIRLDGLAISPYLTDLAKLRLEIFREYPYLYQGNFAQELNYLKTYSDCPYSTVIIILHQQQVIGAATAIPLEFTSIATRKPFTEQKIAIQQIFYFGELLLLPTYRRQHLGSQLLHQCEVAALEYGATMTTFCMIQRPTDDPRRPVSFSGLDKTCARFGYEKQIELCGYFTWQEIDKTSPSIKPLIFWLKKLV